MVKLFQAVCGILPDGDKTKIIANHWRYVGVLGGQDPYPAFVEALQQHPQWDARINPVPFVEDIEPLPSEVLEDLKDRGNIGAIYMPFLKDADEDITDKLDSTIHGIFADMASGVNNRGVEGQVQWLIEHGDLNDLDEIFEAMTDSDR